MKTKTLLGLSLLSLSLSVSATDKRQLDAHEHGVAVVNIALEENTLLLEMESPAMNIVGFEYVATTAEQKAAIEDALAQLQLDSSLITTDSAAGCELQKTAAQYVTEAEHGNDGHDEHADHDDDHSENHDEHAGHDDDHSDHDDDHDAKAAQHAEFLSQLWYECAQPEQLATLRITLFETFPLTTEVAASFVGPVNQAFKALTPDSAVLRVAP